MLGNHGRVCQSRFQSSTLRTGFYVGSMSPSALRLAVGVGIVRDVQTIDAHDQWSQALGRLECLCERAACPMRLERPYSVNVKANRYALRPFTSSARSLGRFLPTPCPSWTYQSRHTAKHRTVWCRISPLLHGCSGPKSVHSATLGRYPYVIECSLPSCKSYPSRQSMKSPSSDMYLACPSSAYEGRQAVSVTDHHCL